MPLCTLKPLDDCEARKLSENDTSLAVIPFGSTTSHCSRLMTLLLCTYTGITIV